MSATAKIRLVAINDVGSGLSNLSKLQTFLGQLDAPIPQAVIVAGNFLRGELTAIDGGRGVVSAMTSSGITHACLGASESQVDLGVLKDRIQDMQSKLTVINTNMRSLDLKEENEYSRIHSNKLHWNQILKLTPPVATVQSDCGKVSVALLGLLGNCNPLFRGCIPIDNVHTAFTQTCHSLLEQKDDTDAPLTVEAIMAKKRKELGLCTQPQEPATINTKADFIIPITHQSNQRDCDLARHMLHTDPQGMYQDKGLVIIAGGPAYDKNNCNDSKDLVQIVRPENQAKVAALVDLEFDLLAGNKRPKLSQIETSYIDLEASYSDSVVVQSIIDQHARVIRTLQDQVLVDLSSDEMVLSSDRTIHTETSVGMFFANAIQQELQADVALLPRGVPKGNTTYPDSKMTYAQLQNELPKTCDIIVVPMTRLQIYQAITVSRMNTKQEEDGYLQTNDDFDDHSYPTASPEEILQVALPRNLLGWEEDCDASKIQPLIELGKQLKDNHHNEDSSSIPALDLVTRHCCKNRWVDILQQNNDQGTIAFGDIDINNDGVLDQHEIKLLLQRMLGYEPDDQVVQDMINSIDADGNGVIDQDEFGHVLARIEREYKS